MILEALQRGPSHLKYFLHIHNCHSYYRRWGYSYLLSWPPPKLLTIMQCWWSEMMATKDVIRWASAWPGPYIWRGYWRVPVMAPQALPHQGRQFFISTISRAWTDGTSSPGTNTFLPSLFSLLWMQTNTPRDRCTGIPLSQNSLCKIFTPWFIPALGLLLA